MTRLTLKIILAGYAVLLGGFVSLAPLAGSATILALLLAAFGLHLRWIAGRVQG